MRTVLPLSEITSFEPKYAPEISPIIVYNKLLFLYISTRPVFELNCGEPIAIVVPSSDNAIFSPKRLSGTLEILNPFVSIEDRLLIPDIFVQLLTFVTMVSSPV